ncbi:Protein TOS4 [Nakaseomyces bracarensis]|uniref:Protein TOS4 n=1 Tax=Nakaseomyces bracarensis TaxID=273131 RepID=A0ABR4NYL0_9SACH
MQFPPSSPVRAASDHSKPNPFYQPSSEADYSKLQPFQLKPVPVEPTNDYPTPFPSSTTGRSSSPVRHAESRPISDSPPLTTSPPRINDFLKPTDPLEGTPVYTPPVEKPVAITLNHDRLEPLVIGRKGSCDIILPNRPKISRKHALVTYLSTSNQIKLKCLGSNGLVVLLPKKYKCKLVRLTQGVKNVIRDTECLEYALVEDPSCIVPFRNEKIVMDVELTSFTLLENESVIMPYIKGTVLDFREVEGVLTVKKQRKRHSYLVNKPAMEMQKSSTSSLTEFSSTSSSPLRNLAVSTKLTPISLHKFGNTKPYGVASSKFMTPDTCSKITKNKSPRTPMKLVHSDLKISTQQTPINNVDGKILKKSLGDSGIKKRNNEGHLEGKNLNEPGHKKMKKEQKKLTKEQILENMKTKNVDIQDLTNVLTNHLAFANVQQTPLFQLQKVSSKTAELSRSELRALLGSINCIGIIYRQGKDAAGKPLDEEYFYDLENDDDSERRNLVQSLKGGRSGLRSCRKTHKQYFWKRPAK